MSNPSILNATITPKVYNGVTKGYDIAPNSGYVLHDNRCDEQLVDPITLMPTGEVRYRYATGSVSVGVNYDFTLVVPNVIQDINGNDISVNMVGAFEFFAVPASAIPENQTYGGSNHEVMSAEIV